MCLCVTDQRWIYHCCSAQCTIDSGASSTATLWWWCLRERAAPTEQLAPVDAARANPMTRESKWLQQVIGLQRASWVHSWYSELYELYACQCSVSVRKPVFFSKSDSRDITDVWSECCCQLQNHHRYGARFHPYCSVKHVFTNPSYIAVLKSNIILYC